ncbi:MAG: hypothetical protein HFJ86_08615 [Oscillospiraceae bacterium]|jgi:hypothetical protein|nr:hypothetical protein [Oscillospiraceae bacterium]
MNRINRMGRWQAARPAAAKKTGWEMSDSLKETIGKLAQEDARAGVYMGEEFAALRRAEVAKAAPNRAAVLAKVADDREILQEIKEADQRLAFLLFGKRYEAQGEPLGIGSAVHVYDENGEEILTYTQGAGWHEKETKAETAVHREIKMAYYEAYHAIGQNGFEARA